MQEVWARAAEVEPMPNSRRDWCRVARRLVDIALNKLYELQQRVRG